MGAESVWKISELSSQYSCEPKTALKKNPCKEKKMNMPMVGASVSLRTSVMALLCRLETVGEVLRGWGSGTVKGTVGPEVTEPIGRCLIA